MNTISKTPDPTIVYLMSVVLYSGGLGTNYLRCRGRGHQGGGITYMVPL